MLSNTAHGSSRNRNHVSTIHLVYLAISINLIKHKDVRFGPKVGQSGPKWDFFRSDFSTFWRSRIPCWKSLLSIYRHTTTEV